MCLFEFKGPLFLFSSVSHFVVLFRSMVQAIVLFWVISTVGVRVCGAQIPEASSNAQTAGRCRRRVRVNAAKSSDKKYLRFCNYSTFLLHWIFYETRALNPILNCISYFVVCSHRLHFVLCFYWKQTGGIKLLDRNPSFDFHLKCTPSNKIIAGWEVICLELIKLLQVQDGNPI